MWIQIRTMDGKKSFQVDNISKLTKIEELRQRMEKDLEAISSRQRLFFAGKQVNNFISGLLIFMYINGVFIDIMHTTIHNF